MKKDSSDSESQSDEAPAAKKAKKDDSSSDSDAPIKENPEEEKVEEKADEEVNDEHTGKLELFVQGLGEASTEDSLRAHFEAYGTLTKVKLLYNKGKAFIEFEEHSQARKALNATN